MRTASAQHIIRVYEQQEWRLGEALADGLRLDKELLQVFAGAPTSPIRKGYQVLHQGIRFKQYVGIFQLGSYVIEIWPKLDRNPYHSTAVWADFLVALLKESGELPLLDSGQVQQSMSSSFLADLLAESFVRHLQVIVRQGLLQQYTSADHRSKWPRGPIQWSKQIHRPPQLPPILEQKIRQRNHRHPYNGWLAAAITQLQTWPLRLDLQKQLQELQSIFPPAVWPNPVQLIAAHYPSGASGRTYRPALQIAMHLFRAQGHQLRAGQLMAPAILFDMNVLFEAYIFRQLKKHLPKGAKISRQQSQVFWRKHSVRPDILLELEGIPYVLDTKWKQLSNANPSAEDLRQLYVYQRVFGARRGVLIYPKVDGLAWQAAHPYQSVVAEPLPYKASLIFASVLKEGQLNHQLGAEIIEGLRTT